MPPSVQVMFNGPGFNPEWLLMKAEHENKVMMAEGEGTRFMENAANLSVTLAHMADWVLAFNLPAFSHCKDVPDVVKYVKTSCPKAALFFDINNEYKHADRHPRTASKTTASVLLYYEIHDKATDLTALNDGTRIFNSANDGKKVAVFTPKIKDCSGTEFLFSECAAEAIRWWRSVI